jgi:hypothetical protein
MTYGFSPLLHFDIPLSEDLSETVSKAVTHFRCLVDGEILEDEFQKIVCLRTEEG